MSRKRTTPTRQHSFVLDCSVTMAWYFRDEASPYAVAVRKALDRQGAMAATLWPLEVANSLLQGERRNRSTPAEANKWLHFLGLLPIRIDKETPDHAWSDILQLARSQQLTAYDAAYLELALRLDLPLASTDDRLKAAAAQVGVRLFEP